jgi:hypothetical protein
MLSTISYRAESSRRAAAGHPRLVSPISARLAHQGRSSTMEAVRKLEGAIRRLESESNLTNPCEVALFEIDGDTSLHCNVTHRHLTRSVAGWAGPGRVAAGFVHNRRFQGTRHLLRHIREMVDAPRA